MSPVSASSTPPVPTVRWRLALLLGGCWLRLRTPSRRRASVPSLVRRRKLVAGRKNSCRSRSGGRRTYSSSPAMERCQVKEVRSLVHVVPRVVICLQIISRHGENEGNCRPGMGAWLGGPLLIVGFDPWWQAESLCQGSVGGAPN